MIAHHPVVPLVGEGDEGLQSPVAGVGQLLVLRGVEVCLVLAEAMRAPADLEDYLQLGPGAFKGSAAPDRVGREGSSEIAHREGLPGGFYVELHVAVGAPEQGPEDTGAAVRDEHVVVAANGFALGLVPIALEALRVAQALGAGDLDGSAAAAFEGKLGVSGSQVAPVQQHGGCCAGGTVNGAPPSTKPGATSRLEDRTTPPSRSGVSSIGGIGRGVSSQRVLFH